MWDLIVLVPDHCLSFYFALHPDDRLLKYVKRSDILGECCYAYTYETRKSVAVILLNFNTATNDWYKHLSIYLSIFPYRPLEKFYLEKYNEKVFDLLYFFI